MMRKRLCILLACILLPVLTYAAVVNETERDIPVAYDVDVVVIGGTSAGVAAAVEAARNGAEVFLAAPRPYLGEDVCATYRLWLQPDEKPQSALAKEMFTEPFVAPSVGKSIPFKYEADRPSAGKHKDRVSPPMLSDGQWGNAGSQSVQYDGNVSIVVDLLEKKHFERVHVMAYQRVNDFAIEKVIVSSSDDKQNWKQIATIQNELQRLRNVETSAFDMAGVVDGNARYIKLDIVKHPRAKRVLIGEIVIEANLPEVQKTKARRPPTPLHVKYTLDQALLDSGVQFLYSCYTTEVLRDANGKPAGIVMVNRSGRQAVKAKAVIDAMQRADVARMAGGEFEPYPSGTQTFKRIVIGGEVPEESDLDIRIKPSPVYAKMREQYGMHYTAYEYTLDLPMKDGSFASFAKAEQIARDKTWHRNQKDSSEELFQIPPDPMKGQKSLTGAWPGADKADLGAFRPAGVERLYVLGPCADVSRQAAEELYRPLEYMKLGKRIGKAAAEEARNLPEPKGVHLDGEIGQPAATGDVKELLTGLRPVSEESSVVLAEDRSLPVLGEYDVVVIGGGTGGAPAGIGAARQGAKTLVVEYLHGLGGVGTLGLIGHYYHGHKAGFTSELDQDIEELATEENKKLRGWDVELKMEWYRKELRKAGADIWFGVLGCGAFVEDGKVKGAVVATPEGRGVVLTDVTIDSTGSSDIAIAAGADYMFTSAENAALQGTGLPPRQPGANYTNTDYTFTDDTDVVDIWRSFVIAKEKYKGSYDLGQLIDTRERRRIVGDYVQSPLDIVNQRTFPDTVNLSKSNFDSHGFTIHPRFMMKPPDRKGMEAYTPYRCMLPKGLDGIIVTGLGISAHRDAMPILRMQACIQNQGYAMGVAASMAAKNNQSTRDIDIKNLQKHLVKKGNLPESVLTDKDSYPMSDEVIGNAVKSVIYHYDWILESPKELEEGDKMPPPALEPIGVILAHPEESLPLLQEAYKEAESENDKLIYAHILGMMGDSTGSESLIKAVESREWDEGWAFKGGGQFGTSLSPVDSLIIALGRTQDKRGVQPIIGKVEQLDANSDFSHHRAVAIALETLGEAEAAKPLAELLQKPRMRGQSFSTIEEAKEIIPLTSANDNTTRDYSLRELILARALYRCGDYNGLGKQILEEYAHDLRGHQARHAHAILAEGKAE